MIPPATPESAAARVTMRALPDQAVVIVGTAKTIAISAARPSRRTGALSSTTACRAVPADRPSPARHWAAGKRRYKLRRMLGLVTRVKAARLRTQTLFELNLEVDTLWRAP